MSEQISNPTKCFMCDFEIDLDMRAFLHTFVNAVICADCYRQQCELNDERHRKERKRAERKRAERKRPKWERL